MREKSRPSISTTLIAIVVIIIVVVAGIGGYWYYTTLTHKHKGFVIALSNGFYGNIWRPEMEQDFMQLMSQLEQQGTVSKYYISNAGPSVSAQISAIQNFISMHVNAILIDPNSATGLNSVIQQAVNAGILVVCFDQGVSSPYAINVVYNQTQWFATEAKWLVTQLNGSGNIIIVNGVAGNPANDQRYQGAMAVINQYPNIHVISTVYGGWDPASAEAAVEPIIASHPNINGILTQDSMIEGILAAYDALGIPYPKVFTADYAVGFLQEWNNTLVPKGYHVMVVENPPGYSLSAAVWVTVNLLEGKKLNTADLGYYMGAKNTVYIPLPPVITNSNVSQIYVQYQNYPSSWLVDYEVNQSQVAGYFG